MHYICTQIFQVQNKKFREKKEDRKRSSKKASDMDEEMSGVCVKARGSSGGSGNKCGRWNPTSEQVKVLTDLFRSGLRTPSTDQIQKISSQLSFYGKIESKNVFYWFQNHKARERQKRRRVSLLVDDHHEQHHHRKKDDKTIASTKCFGDVNKVMDSERVIETLQLFPLNSYNEIESEKLRLIENECKKDIFNTKFSTYTFDMEMNHPPLDLRLSFL